MTKKRVCAMVIGEDRWLIFYSLVRSSAQNASSRSCRQSSKRAGGQHTRSRLRFVMDGMSAEFVSRVNTLHTCFFYFGSMNMASLSPPIKSRSRASSTNLRPAITIHTLGRRRSTSCLQQQSPIDEPSSHESSLVLFLSKLIHAHGLASPTADDFVLPSHSIKPSHRLSVCLALVMIIIIVIVLFTLPSRYTPPFSLSSSFCPSPPH